MFFMTLRYFTDSRRKSRAARTMGVENMRILFGFAIVTGINTLLLTISLGLLYTGWLDFAGIVAALVLLLTRFGVFAGKRGWMNMGRTAELLASILMIALAVVILLQYLNFI
jgi:putative Mn2+ efflux pump MntP